MLEFPRPWCALFLSHTKLRGALGAILWLPRLLVQAPSTLAANSCPGPYKGSQDSDSWEDESGKKPM